MAKREKLFGGFGQLKSDVKSTQEQIKENIEILPVLRDLIPPLSAEERNQLEINLLSDGVREPLIVWRNPDSENYILLDGHNRYEICTKLNLDFKVQEVKTNLKNIEQAKEWMILNQLGKRNLSENQKSYFRGKQYETEKQSHGGARISSIHNEHLKNEEQNQEQISSIHNEHLKNNEEQNQKTIDKLATLHKVSASTINRDQKYAQNIDILVAEDADLRWKILNKEIDIPKKNLEKLIEQTENLPQIRQYLKDGKDLKMIKQIFFKFSPVNRSVKQEKLMALKSAIIDVLGKVIQKQDETSLEKLKGFITELDKLIKE